MHIHWIIWTTEIESIRSSVDVTFLLSTFSFPFPFPIHNVYGCLWYYVTYCIYRSFIQCSQYDSSITARSRLLLIWCTLACSIGHKSMRCFGNRKPTVSTCNKLLFSVCFRMIVYIYIYYVSVCMVWASCKLSKLFVTIAKKELKLGWEEPKVVKIVKQHICAHHSYVFLVVCVRSRYLFRFPMFRITCCKWNIAQAISDSSKTYIQYTQYIQ